MVTGTKKQVFTSTCLNIHGTRFMATMGPRKRRPHISAYQTLDEVCPVAPGLAPKARLMKTPPRSRKTTAHSERAFFFQHCPALVGPATGAYMMRALGLVAGRTEREARLFQGVVAPSVACLAP